MKAAPVLVTEGKERAALAVTRALGAAGIPVIVGAETERSLAGAPAVHVLATSREPLAIDGEVQWSVPPLQLPSPAVERVRAVLPRCGVDPEPVPVADLVALGLLD